MKSDWITVLALSLFTGLFLSVQSLALPFVVASLVAGVLVAAIRRLFVYDGLVTILGNHSLTPKLDVGEADAGHPVQVTVLHDVNACLPGRLLGLSGKSAQLISAYPLIPGSLVQIDSHKIVMLGEVAACIASDEKFLSRVETRHALHRPGRSQRAPDHTSDSGGVAEPVAQLEIFLTNHQLRTGAQPKTVYLILDP